MYNAHAHRHTQPSSHILILPNWQHSPYLARNLQINLDPIPPIPQHPKSTHTAKLNIYLVANEKALQLLNHYHVIHTLREALSCHLDQETQPIKLNLNIKDSPHLDNSQAYKDRYPSIPSKPYTKDLTPIHPYHATWNSTNFIYTDGSMVAGNPTLGASVVNPSL